MQDKSSHLSVLIAIVVLIAVVVAVFVWFMLGRRRSARLRKDFGTEYEHVVIERGDARVAEKELRARQERVEDYDLHPIPDRERKGFIERWQQVQNRFVDAPAAAVADAQVLCNEAMEARGYPIGDFERQVADVSVESPGVVSHYRRAREIAAARSGEASTEDLRGAMKHYRELFDSLLRAGDENGRHDVNTGGQDATRGAYPRRGTG
ncbi:MAG: hypothetical protein ACRELU_02195 [Gemmatimonadota bacterium]